jgi:hypothetical protein
VVARRDARDAVADRLDHAGALVAQDRRPRMGVDAVDHVQVGVADAARSHPDGDLPGSGRIDLDILDAERISRLVQNRSPHTLTVPAVKHRRLTPMFHAPG